LTKGLACSRLEISHRRKIMNFNELTYRQLRTFCKENRVRGYGKLDRDGMIGLLRALYDEPELNGQCCDVLEGWTGRCCDVCNYQRSDLVEEVALTELTARVVMDALFGVFVFALTVCWFLVLVTYRAGRHSGKVVISFADAAASLLNSWTAFSERYSL